MALSAVLTACGTAGTALPQIEAPQLPDPASSAPTPAEPAAPADPAAPATPATPTTPATPGTPTTPAPDCAGYTWLGNAKAFFSAQCYGCHSSPGSTFDGSSQASVKTNLGRIVDSIETGRMPLGGQRVDTATAQKLRAWMLCNAP